MIRRAAATLVRPVGRKVLPPKACLPSRHMAHAVVASVAGLALLGASLVAKDEVPGLPERPNGSRRLWTRLKPADHVPVNLANKSISGCTIQSSKGVGHPEALISTDPTENFEVPVGKSEVVVRLGGSRLLNNIDFINDHIAASLLIETSADNRHWQTIATAALVEHQRQMEVHFADVECRSVRLTFDARHGGEVRGWDFYGPMGREDFEFSTAADAGIERGDPDFNLAAAGIAVPIYAFPTPVNDWETGMLHHVFRFPKTNEKYRTIIYDLGSVYSLKEFSVAYSQRPVRVELFLFEELNEKRNSRGKLAFDPEVLNQTKPHSFFEDIAGHGHVKFKDKNGARARYVVFRYEPEYHRKDKAAVAGLRLGDLLPGLDQAGLLATVPIPPQEEYRMVAGDTDTPFEHNDTNIIPVGRYVLMPASGAVTSHVAPLDYYSAPYVPFIPAGLPAIPAPAAGLPRSEVPPRVRPPVIPPVSP